MIAFIFGEVKNRTLFRESNLKIKFANNNIAMMSYTKMVIQV